MTDFFFVSQHHFFYLTYRQERFQTFFRFTCWYMKSLRGKLAGFNICTEESITNLHENIEKLIDKQTIPLSRQEDFYGSGRRGPIRLRSHEKIIAVSRNLSLLVSIVYQCQYVQSAKNDFRKKDDKKMFVWFVVEYVFVL